MMKPPRSNVPGQALPWSREIESAYQEIDALTVKLERDVEVREIAASIDLLSANIQNLNARQPQFMTPKTGLMITSPDGGAGSSSWTNWTFNSLKAQTVAISGNIRAYARTGDPLTRINIKMRFPTVNDVDFIFSPNYFGDPATSDFTLSFNGIVDLNAGPYTLSTTLFSGAVDGFYRGVTSATYDVSLAVFPQ